MKICFFLCPTLISHFAQIMFLLETSSYFATIHHICYIFGIHKARAVHWENMWTSQSTSWWSGSSGMSRNCYSKEVLMKIWGFSVFFGHLYTIYVIFLKSKVSILYIKKSYRHHNHHQDDQEAQECLLRCNGALMKSKWLLYIYICNNG